MGGMSAFFSQTLGFVADVLEELERQQQQRQQQRGLFLF
jgi:hypothetical protein